MPETCRPLGWRCSHFQIADPLLKTRLPRKVAGDMIVSLMSNSSGPIRPIFERQLLQGKLSWSRTQCLLMCALSLSLRPLSSAYHSSPFMSVKGLFLPGPGSFNFFIKFHRRPSDCGRSEHFLTSCHLCTCEIVVIVKAWK